ncbi:V-type ATP synthase subunit D [Candidatus Clavichlamydia salmonicola]|uniref:V-type ATP synthase subunit D n=1 Tax=Candidatus Clavichlamydia salmonicola TaxID=469812 RepID=UPI0018919685|nr:V-type ATP synthase subunit D [Candidatus Clavichlamydia salmonicola]MBF5051113.1 V-type ATP synthase subunit D [Candidatus Clavichlamydia salmonicola]
MKTLRLTKNELKGEMSRLARLEQYLPTLKLKKVLLQCEVDQMLYEQDCLKEKLDAFRDVLMESAILFTVPTHCPIKDMLQIEEISYRKRNIAGMEVKFVDYIDFKEFFCGIIDTPVWWDSFIEQLRNFKKVFEQVKQVNKNKEILDKELHTISLRVSLFEKNLIPKTLQNIKKIRIFLEDQAISTLGQIKMAKKKLQMKNSRAI